MGTDTTGTPRGAGTPRGSGPPQGAPPGTGTTGTPPGTGTTGTTGTATTVVPLDSPALLRSLHRDVLEPSFPPAERTTEEELLADHAAGRLRSLGVVEDGRVTAGVVGAWSPATRVLLVVYLAIAPGRRGSGVGGRLVAAALDAWAEALDPVLAVGEVEHPAHHTASAAYGDPEARLRFYARLGARVLDVPYFQPGGSPGGERVPALLLVALPLPGSAGGATDAPGPPLRAFLEENLREHEGGVTGDRPTRELLEAASGPRVALVDPADPVALAAVPVAVLRDDELRAPA